MLFSIEPRVGSQYMSDARHEDQEAWTLDLAFQNCSEGLSTTVHAYRITHVTHGLATSDVVMCKGGPDSGQV